MCINKYHELNTTRFVLYMETNILTSS